MPRSNRVEFEGAIHHVWMRGNRKQTIFVDDGDRSFFLSGFDSIAQLHRWTCLSYCLMSNHCHFVIETPEKTLGKGMHQFNTRYARTFNDRHVEVGRLYQGRYGSRIVDTDEYLAQLFRYVALNPVTAGLCSAPGDWRWSSHRQMLAGAEGIADRSRVDELLGGDRYVELFEPTHPLAVKFGAEDPWTWRPSLSSLLSAPSRSDGIRAARDYGYKLREIAAALGVSTTTVWRVVNRSEA